MDDVFEVGLVNQCGELLRDQGAEFVGLSGKFVSEFGAAGGEDDDVVDVEASGDVAVAAAAPGGEFVAITSGGATTRMRTPEASVRSIAVSIPSGY